MTESIANTNIVNKTPIGPSGVSSRAPIDESQQNRASLGGKPIISIKEARKLLGGDFKDTSDDEIENIIYIMRRIAKGVITK